MSLYGKLIGMSEACWRNLPHIESKVARLLFLPLAKVTYTDSWGDPEVGVQLDELFEILHLPPSYARGCDFTAYLRKYLKKTEEVEVLGTKLIDQWEIENGVLYIRYTESAFNTFFQRLGQFDRRTGQKARYYTILSDDVAKMTKRYTWDMTRMLILRNTMDDQWCTALMTTRELKKYFAMSMDDYMREKGGFDRVNFEKKVLDESLLEISTFQSIRLCCQENDLGKDGKEKITYYQKRYNIASALKQRRTVSCYEVKFKKLSFHSLSDKNLIKNQKSNAEETEMEELFYEVYN